MRIRCLLLVLLLAVLLVDCREKQEQVLSQARPEKERPAVSRSKPDVEAPRWPDGGALRVEVVPKQSSGDANATKDLLRATWSAATDNLGVASYRLWRYGALIATLSPDQLRYERRVTHTYGKFELAACDAAGNCSRRLQTRIGARALAPVETP
jgi:hypothetical protein